MESDETRTRSQRLASERGLAIPDTVPMLEDGLALREQDEAVGRLLCLLATAAASYGFSKSKALSWIEQENLSGGLTNVERRFLEKGDGHPQMFMGQIEGMWALAWALNLVSELNFWKDCAKGFVNTLPDLKINQASTELRRKAVYRQASEVVSACDLAYCLHWAVRQAEIEGKQPPAKLKGYVVVERRRALEWVLCNESWSDIALDT